MNEFSKGIEQGQSDTQEALKSIRSGKGLGDDYAYKIAKPILFLSFIGGLASFIFSWLFFHFNFFVAIIIGVITGYLLLLVLGFVIAGLFKFVSRSDRYKS
ncbi:hypothetical protein HY029_00035 [Candidatus Gottesmanbacteria bacterium]|nr:hypothetical protein [Candidatus Gottesmanbacteria bacterium]